MRTKASGFGAVCAAVLLAGCGYVGEPLYPTTNTPSSVADLNAVERGGKILVAFTIPPLTTDGLPLKSVGFIDLRAGEFTQGEFSENAWAGQAHPIPVTAPEKPSMLRAEIPIDGLIGKNVIIGVRIGGPKNRMSGWSNLATVNVAPKLDAPASLECEGVAQGVQLRWQAGNASGWRVFRKTEQEKAPSLIEKVDQPGYVDTKASYGTTYLYYVQAEHDRAESEFAGPVTILYADKFAPAVPRGLTAVAGATGIELSWERNTESDFKAYRLYRAISDGTFDMVADNLAAPSYSDTRVESGKRYRYAVAAVDQAGNWSERSAAVEVTAP